MSSSLANKSNNNPDYSPWLFDILYSVQLLQFYNQIAYKLQVTEISHFDYVTVPDLRKIGLSYPAIFRLIDALKKYCDEFNLPQSNAPLYHFQRSHKEKSFKFLRKLFLAKESKINFNSGQSTISLKDLQNLPVYTEGNQTFLLKASEIKFHSKLGSGSSSVVYRGDWTPIGSSNSQKIPVAVKVMKKKFSEMENYSVILSLLNEFKAMQNLRHKNLLILYGISLQDQIMIITELAPLGSLLRMLRVNKSVQNEEMSKINACFMVDSLWNICHQIVDGMNFLSDANFIHRDLAARNVFVFSIKQNSYPLVKIGDFGMTRCLDHEESEYCEETLFVEDTNTNVEEEAVYKSQFPIPLPIAWSAIECLESNTFSEASDVWSWGVLSWEIWTFGARPWPRFKPKELIDKLRNGHRLAWPKLNCPRSMYQLMLSSWNLNPNARPCFQYLSERLHRIRPFPALAKENFDEIDRLGVEKNDIVQVFDAPTNSCWWRGQNSRTGEIGSIPNILLEIVDQRLQKLFSNRRLEDDRNIDDTVIYSDLNERESATSNETIPDQSMQRKEGDLKDERNLLKEANGTIESKRKIKNSRNARNRMNSQRSSLPEDYKSPLSLYCSAPSGPLEDYIISDLENNQTSFKVGGLKDPRFPLHMPSGRIGTSDQFDPFHNPSSAPSFNKLNSDDILNAYLIQDEFVEVKPSAPTQSKLSLNNQSLDDIFNSSNIFSASFVETNTPSTSRSQNITTPTTNRNATTGGDAFWRSNPIQQPGINLSFQNVNHLTKTGTQFTSLFSSPGQNPFGNPRAKVNPLSTWDKLNKLDEVFLDPIDQKLEVEAVARNFASNLINEETIKAALAKVLSTPPKNLGSFIPLPVPFEPCSLDNNTKSWRIEAVTRLIKLDRLESLLILNRQTCCQILYQNNWDLQKSQAEVLSKRE